MTTNSAVTTRRLLGALFELEDIIRSLSGERRAAAIDLVTERVRRLRGRRRSTPPPEQVDHGAAQIDLEELLHSRSGKPSRRKQRGTRRS